MFSEMSTGEQIPSESESILQRPQTLGAEGTELGELAETKPEKVKLIWIIPAVPYIANKINCKHNSIMPTPSYILIGFYRQLLYTRCTNKLANL